MDIFDWTKLSQ